jgi:hypothetical protein
VSSGLNIEFQSAALDFVEPACAKMTDRSTSCSDWDFHLGLNAAQTSVAAIAQLADAS